jgi:methylated-DNA-protein-cysteine methyltransferase-like protein
MTALINSALLNDGEGPAKIRFSTGGRAANSEQLIMARTKFNAREMFGPLSAQRSRPRSHVEPEMNHVLEAIWNVIAAIPRGQVSTYGDVALMAGLPGRARLTAYALRNMPEGMHLPWHRVLGAGGKIVFPKESRHHREQARRLRSDGIPVKDGRVPRAVIMDVGRF